MMKIVKSAGSNKLTINRLTVKAENEALWEELEMSRSKKATKSEKSYKLEDVLSGIVRRTTTTY